MNINKSNQKIIIQFLKITSIIILNTLIFFNSFFLSKFTVFAEITYFAHIVNNQTYFYNNPDENSTLFVIPETYFVELLSNSDNELFYYAKYNDLYGYVKKDMVKPITGTPNYPYLNNVSFRVFVPSGANLRASPYNLGATNLIYSVPFLETNLLYYGTINGEESISKKGNVWYYCKYYMNNLSYCGYIYSPLTDLLSPIQPNTETYEYIEGELKFYNYKEENIGINAMESLSPTTQTILIIAISLPCLLFIYLLFKPSKMAENSSSSKSKKSNNKKKISRLKHSDYYEYDDDFY